MRMRFRVISLKCILYLLGLHADAYIRFQGRFVRGSSPPVVPPLFVRSRPIAARRRGRCRRNAKIFLLPWHVIVVVVVVVVAVVVGAAVVVA